jgi:hypothetical protein
MKQFIPARGVLKSRHIEKLAFCEACGKQEETIQHALFDCTWAKIFWAELRSMAGVKIPILHPSSWAMDLIDGCGLSEEHTSLVLCGCWASWKERNARKHGEGDRSVTDSVRWVMHTTIDLSQVGKEKVERIPKKKECWKAPEEGVIKINTDASFFDTTMSGGTGLVVRDHRGSLIRGHAIWYEHAANALMMEARAILDGARLSMERNYNQVITQSDSQGAVNLCNGNGINRSKLTVCGLTVTHAFS